MKKLSLSTLFLLIWLGSLAGQSERDFTFYEDSTLSLYQQARWDQLAPLAREALQEGFDYYYLRMRLGIAYFETKRPQRAIPQFYRALRHNTEDPVAGEYLYYSLLYAGRADEARLFADAFSVKEGRQPHSGTLDLFANATYKWSDGRTEVGNLEDYSLGIRHSLGRRLTFSHTYECLRQHFVETIVTEEPPGNGNGPPVVATEERPYHFDQQFYRLNAQLQLKRGWQAGFTFNYAWVQSEDHDFEEQYYFGYLSKQLPALQLKAGLGHSNFHDTYQRQLGFDLTYYPLYNTDLYVHGSCILKEETGSGELQHLTTFLLGGRIAPNTWLEGRADIGRINYFQEALGTVVYNIPDELKSRAGLTLAHWIKGRHPVFLSLQLEEKERWATLETYRHYSLTIGSLINLR